MRLFYVINYIGLVLLIVRKLGKM